MQVIVNVRHHIYCGCNRCTRACGGASTGCIASGSSINSLWGACRGHRHAHWNIRLRVDCLGWVLVSSFRALSVSPLEIKVKVLNDRWLCRRSRRQNRSRFVIAAIDVNNTGSADLSGIVLDLRLRCRKLALTDIVDIVVQHEDGHGKPQQNHRRQPGVQQTLEHYQNDNRI